MVKIKVKSDRKFTILVPYFALNFATTIMLTNFVWKKITKSDHYSNELTPISKSPINNKLLKPLLKIAIKEAKYHRGTTILEVKSSQGEEITIRL
ncbi:hypothetical protein [Paucisalibacillus sp. EB02]|uniref:hypothetical protein n=1 Tax=Paucisalibacillus sp. EB02 TaxID=1347087 RepID=UPI0004B63969|nr:hypothetical protein [Paucisalibacillus sp. EB02]